MTPYQLGIKESYILDAYQALEEEIMKRLIERLNAKTFVELSKDNIFQWQLEKLQQIGLLDLETIATLAEQTATVSKDQLRDLIVNQGYDINTKANDDLAEIANVPARPWNNLTMILEQYLDSSWLALDNHINQTLISTNYSKNWVAQKYQQILNDVVTKTLTGFTTPQKAIKDAIYDMVSKGMMTTFTDKAGNTWTLERYVKMVVDTTTSHVYNDLRTERAINEYGIVTALMSSHLAARESCSHIQGKFVLMVPTAQAPEEYQYLPSIYDYGYGDPDGTMGINCKHRFYSMLPMPDTGIPTPPSAEQAQENSKIVAKQRRMEVTIRNAKKQLKAAELMDDEQGKNYFNGLVRKRQGALRQLINDNEKLLHRDYSREQIYS